MCSFNDHLPDDRLAERRKPKRLGAGVEGRAQSRGVFGVDAGIACAPGAVGAVILGAPNVIRGGSHNGNVRALELIGMGLCDALASYYLLNFILDLTGSSASIAENGMSTVRRFGSAYGLVHGNVQRFAEGPHRCLAITVSSGMRSLRVVFGQPDIEIGLQLLHRPIELLAEGDVVELVLDGAVMVR